MIKLTFIQLLLLFASFFCFTSINCENIPVFLYGSESSAYSPALKVYESADFANFVSSQFDDSTVAVVFTENTLSVENISSCKHADGTTCFKNLESKKSRTYLPYVSNPIPTLKDIAEFKKQETAHLNTDGTLSPVDIEAGSFLFVTLNDYTINEDKVDVFSRHDKFIEKIVSELSEKFNVLAIYTGNHSPLSVTHSRKVRQTAPPPPEPSSNATFLPIDNGRALLIFNQISILEENGNETVIKMNSAKIVNDTELSVDFEVTGEATLGIKVSNARGNWNIDGLLWNNQKLYMRDQISINHGHSYHCAQKTNYYTMDKKITVVIEGIQFQPTFGKDGNITSFGDSWDCLGFTSGGIWAGLFVTFILLFILSIGLSWMMDIKTMDKFDDPKGKTITVNVTE